MVEVPANSPRLRVTQGRHDEARQILVPVYDRFAEGSATADLRAARTMLDALPREMLRGSSHRLAIR